MRDRSSGNRRNSSKVFSLTGKFDHSQRSEDSEADNNSSKHLFKMKQLPLLARQFLAEFLGTFLLVLFGDGAIAQYKYLEPNNKNFLSVAFGYGLGLMIGILVSGNVSGGHLNPAVTLSMACLKKCKWICVPVYWLAQYLGALLGAAVLLGVYNDAINANGKDLDSAGIFASYPSNTATTVTLVFDQALGTAFLLIIILAVTDKRNMDVSSGLIPLLIGLGLTAIHISFAFNAGCAINPARDFSP